MTHADIIKIYGEGAADETIIAINNRIGGVLEVPDPDEVVDWEEGGKYQIFLSSSSKVAVLDEELVLGASDIYAMTAGHSGTNRGGGGRGGGGRFARRSGSGTSGRPSAGGGSRGGVEVFLLQSAKDIGVATRNGGGKKSGGDNSMSPSSTVDAPDCGSVEPFVLSTRGQKVLRLSPTSSIGDANYSYHMPKGDGISDLF